MGSTQEASCKKDVEKAVSFCPNHPTCLSASSLIADTHSRICLERKEPGVCGPQPLVEYSSATVATREDQNTAWDPSDPRQEEEIA